MQITDILAQLGGLQSMARELGVDEGQAAAGAEALVPAILGGFKKQAQPAGIEGLGGLLGQLGGADLLDNVLAPQPTDVSRGDAVLGQIFGSKDVSRAVAQNAAAQSGLDPSMLKRMLPMLAMLVAGFMARQGSGAEPAAQGSPLSGPGGLAGLGGSVGGTGAGGLGGMLGGLLGGQGAGAAPSLGGAGGLASMLDLNGDGNPLDDILGMAKRAMR